MPRGHDDLLLAPPAPVTLEHTQSPRDEPLPQATRYLHPKFLKAHAEFRDLAGQLSANRPGFVPEPVVARQLPTATAAGPPRGGRLSLRPAARRNCLV
jgi:hypothetical protein